VGKIAVHCQNHYEAHGYSVWTEYKSVTLYLNVITRTLLGNDLHCSPNNVGVTESRRMRWAGHVASTGRGEVYTGFWWGNLRERDNLEDRGVDGRIMLSWIYRKWDVGV
jgi:hypothetical protein